ncbi:MAG: N-acetylmuramoyl-L-alanine amidase, partial [Verrucomicrobiota bacterium]
LSLTDVQRTLTPAFLPTAVEKVGKVKTVVFDPGHGGHDPGAISRFGYEKNFALDVVRRTRKILEGRGYKVVQSRLTDFFVPLHERPAMTKNYENPIFVSVHFNGSSNKKASGFEIFTITPNGAPPTGKDEDKKSDDEEQANAPYEAEGFLLANTIYQTLIGEFEVFDRGVKRQRYSVLRRAETPAVLVEGGFLSNYSEAKQISTTAWRDKFSTALADGIEAYIKFANDQQLPKSALELGRTPTNEFVPE